MYFFIVMSGGKVSARCPGSERKKTRTTLVTTTEKLSEVDKETSSLSYVQDENLGNVHLNLKVKDQDDCFVYYKIKKTQVLKKLMEEYCMCKGLEMSTICFLFDGNRLSETETPSKLNMEDDDMIEALYTRKFVAIGTVHID